MDKSQVFNSNIWNTAVATTTTIATSMLPTIIIIMATSIFNRLDCHDSFVTK